MVSFLRVWSAISRYSALFLAPSILPGAAFLVQSFAILVTFILFIYIESSELEILSSGVVLRGCSRITRKKLQKIREMSGPVDCKVYVGNLGSQGSKGELERVFGYYGSLTNVWVARNPPGFAFVEFENERDARDAVRALDGR